MNKQKYVKSNLLKIPTSERKHISGQYETCFIEDLEKEKIQHKIIKAIFSFFIIPIRFMLSICIYGIILCLYAVSFLLLITPVILLIHLLFPQIPIQYRIISNPSFSLKLLSTSLLFIIGSILFMTLKRVSKSFDCKLKKLISRLM